MKVEQRRRLADLYARGIEVPLGEDGASDVVWVRKMTPADAEVIYIKASAARSSILAMAHSDETSDLYELLKTETAQLSKENKINWLISTDMVEEGQLIQARVAGEPHWIDERYLESLIERSESEDFLAKDGTEDPEVDRVIGELKRYWDEVKLERDEREKELKAEYEYDSDEELTDAVLKTMLEAQANAAWIGEFAKCQIWKCVFEGENHLVPVFSNRQDVDTMQSEVIAKLTTAIDRVHVPDLEGKDSQQTPDS